MWNTSTHLFTRKTEGRRWRHRKIARWGSWEKSGGEEGEKGAGGLIDYSKTFPVFIWCSDLGYLKKCGAAVCMLKSWVQAPTVVLSFHLLRSFFLLRIRWDLKAPAKTCHPNSLNASDSVSPHHMCLFRPVMKIYKSWIFIPWHAFSKLYGSLFFLWIWWHFWSYVLIFSNSPEINCVTRNRYK